MSHTKGKWKIKFDKDKSPIEITTATEIICSFSKTNILLISKLLADARLIAAAPDLLVELRKSHEIITQLWTEIHRNDTKENQLVQRINWPIIRETQRQQAINKAESEV